MSPLDRAVALAEVDAVPVLVEEDLDLDVTRAFDEPFQDQPLVAERALRLAAGRGELRREARRASRTVRMPLPPPPAAGLTRIG